MSSKASSSAPAQITARPTPKPGGATTTTPSVPASTPFTHLSSSGSSYFSAYGAATDPIVQKPAPEPVYSAGALPKENDISKAQIQKPKHKYPFQFLNQVSFSIRLVSQSGQFLYQVSFSTRSVSLSGQFLNQVSFSIRLVSLSGQFLYQASFSIRSVSLSGQFLYQVSFSIRSVSLSG